MKTNYISLLAIALLSLLFAGCSNDEAQNPASREQVKVKFNLQTLAMASRDGTWGDDYTDVAKLDSELSIYTCDGYIYRNGTLFGSFLLYNPIRNEEGYTLDVTLAQGVSTSDVDGESFTAHFVINHVDNGSEVVVDPSTVSTLRSSLTGFYMYAPNDYMPMWGCATCTASVEDNVIYFDFGSVDIIHSVAKIIVTITNPAEQLNEIRLKGNKATYTYVVPSYAPENVTSTGIVPRNPSSVSVPAFGKSSEDYEADSDTDNRSTLMYIPEQSNTEADELTIEVKINGNWMTTPIKFRDYVDGVPTGDPKPILRNHQYRFAITLDNGKFSVVANEWDHTYDNIFNY